MAAREGQDAAVVGASIRRDRREISCRKRAVWSSWSVRAVRWRSVLGKPRTTIASGRLHPRSPPVPVPSWQAYHPLAAARQSRL